MNSINPVCKGIPMVSQLCIEKSETFIRVCQWYTMGIGSNCIYPLKLLAALAVI